MFSQTSVPCDSPEILTSSAKVFGIVSINICLTNGVPNSGTPKVPTTEFISSGVIPKASVPENIFNVSGSAIGIV